MTTAPVRGAGEQIVAAERRHLVLTSESAAMLIATLLWLRWMSNYVVNSLYGDKRYVPIGEVAEVFGPAELTGRVFFLLLLAACGGVVIFRLRDITRVGLVRLSVFLLPWTYLVLRDAYDGTVRSEALPFLLLVLALAVLRPGLPTLRWIGVLVGVTAVVCLCFGALAPDAGIMHEPDGQVRSAAKALVPELGLLIGVFSSENSMAAFLAIGTPLVLLIPVRSVRWILLAAVTAAVVWSSSRGGMLTLGAVLATAGLCRLLRGPRQRGLLAFLLSVGVVLVAAVTVWLPLQPWPDDAFTTRASIWTGSIDRWLTTSDLFGMGSTWYEDIATTTTTPFNGGAYHGHNQFVQAGTTGGVVLVALLGLWLAAMILMTLRRRNPLLPTAGQLLVGVVVAGFLEVPLSFIDRSPYWLVAVVPLVILFFAPAPAPEAATAGAARAPFRESEPRGAGRLLAGTAAVVVLLLAAAAVLGRAGLHDMLTGHGQLRAAPPVHVAPDPFTTRPLYADPASQTTAAARQDMRFLPIAEVPQAKWFTDWSTSVTVEADIATYVTGAQAQHRIPVVVLYRIPERDCGSYAAGGVASPEEYRAWIDAAARGLTGRPAIVVVEPDALAQSDQCGTERVDLLRYATTTMAATGAWVYLDAGHSNWVPAAEMAQRLQAAGVAEARGFSLNVANYRPTPAEEEFGEQVTAELAQLGVKDPHYVIDTSRNGGATRGNDRCNAVGARLGPQPRLTFAGALDGYLWVKNPAESDGPCHGGPQNGFFDQLALMLLGQANEIER